MNRSSIFIWKTSLKSDEDLPECPSDIQEPEYVNLVFGKSCSVSYLNIASGLFEF